MKVLLFVASHPTWGILASAAAGLAGLDWGDHQVTVHVQGEEGVDPKWAPYDQITYKYQVGRAVALAGGYDAMLTVEYDNIVPSDALTRLAAVDADIAYGLYCCRRRYGRWLAFAEIWDNSGTTLTKHAGTALAAWGEVVETQGVGLGCTLIHRRVLEAIPMRREAAHPACNDWFLSLDAKRLGFRQAHDCGCVVGHIVAINPERRVWPQGEEPFYRVENMVTEEVRRQVAKGSGLYKCRVVIYRESEDRYYQPGETIALGDGVAAIHLAKRQVEVLDVGEVDGAVVESATLPVSNRKARG
jgi:hypothetical protein